MTEAQFQRTVVEACPWLGWTVYHTYDSRRSAPGFPDLVLVHPQCGILYRELKTDHGRLTPDQVKWGDLITQAGGDYAIWRPHDWALIEATLKGER